MSLAGPSPFVAVGDRGLVELALRNGVINAVEATREIDAGDDDHSIVVNWNKTDRDYWVAVLDRGPGIPERAAAIFDFGTTTKEGHLGMGLALAIRAARSMRGDLSIATRETEGARYELRWPLSYPGIDGERSDH
jgi:signal transduction histidine kinase